MNKRIVSSMLAASLLVVFSVTLAYAGSMGRMHAAVPFAFTVGNVSFPAGDYTISETSMQGFLLVRNTQEGGSIFVPTLAGSSSGQHWAAKILFNRYGEKYFLSQVSFGIDGDSRELSASRLEKDFAGAARSATRDSRQPEVVAVGSH